MLIYIERNLKIKKIILLIVFIFLIISLFFLKKNSPKSYENKKSLQAADEAIFYK